MLLCELFDEDGSSVMGNLKRALLDFLTPKIAHNMEFVTVQSIIDALRATDSGVDVDRRLVMQMIDPQTLPMVTKIDGDKVYLDTPADPTGGVETDDETSKENDADRVSDMAQKSAVDSLKQK